MFFEKFDESVSVLHGCIEVVHQNHWDLSIAARNEATESVERNFEEILQAVIIGVLVHVDSCKNERHIITRTYL